MKHHVRNLVGVCALVVGFTVSASAQENQGNPTILKGVQNLQAQTDALQATVNALQTTVNAIQIGVGAISAPDQSKVRYTPGLFLDFDQAMLFTVINVGTVPHMVKVEIVDLVGNTKVIIAGAVLQPGHSTSGSTPSADPGPYFMKYTVLDGSRSDIRGSAQQLVASHVVGSALAAE